MRAPTDEKSIQIGEFTLDLDRRGLFRSTERIHLTPKPYEVLVYLVLAKGRLVSKAELLESVWDGHPNENVVEQAVNQIRRALEEDKSKPQFIQTIPGQGYCFVRAKELQPEAAEPTASTQPSRRQILGFAGAGAAAIGAGAVFLSRSHENPKSAELHDRVLTALDGKGEPIWTFELDGQLEPEGVEPFPRTRVAIADLDGNGRNCVLAWARYVPPASGGFRHELICLDSQGRLKWRMRPHPPLLDYDGKPFAQDWFIGSFLVSDSDGPPAVWCALEHRWRFASCLVRIQPNGDQTIQFWPRGWVDSMCIFQRNGRMVLALAGIDSSIDLPFVAIIDAYGPPVCAPLGRADHFRYAFANAPKEIARECILLPNVETNRLYPDLYFAVRSVEYRQPVLMARSLQGRTSTLYGFEFSTDLKPIKVRLQAGYNLIHDEMQKRGIVDHSYQNCPERINGLPLLRWSGEGWTHDSITMSD